jgi:hypothetical protein
MLGENIAAISAMLIVVAILKGLVLKIHLHCAYLTFKIELAQVASCRRSCTIGNGF